MHRLIAMVIALSTASVSHAAHASYDWTAVETRLATAVNRFGLPEALANTPLCQASESCGMQLILSRAEDDVVFDRTFGEWSPERVADIASSSKWPSAALVMTLVDDGSLALGDTVGRWIPEHSGEAEKPITIAQLLSHTSGLPGRHTCLNDRAMTLQACALEILERGVDNPPGSAFDYGGASMQVAGAIAERAGGASWNELFADRIAKPLGMKTFTYGDTANPRIAGGAESDGFDMDRLLRMHLARGVYDGRRILSESAIREMETDRIGDARVAGAPKDAVGYGLGIWIDVVDGTGRATVVSSPGAFGAYPWVDVARGYRGHIAQDTTFLKAEPLWQDLRPLVEQAIDHAGV